MVTPSATPTYYDWCSSNPCRNGFSCYNNRCYCYAGYTGQYCESSVTTTQAATTAYYDWCSPYPCRNGYSCDSYYRRCYCHVGYTGQYCEYYISASPVITAMSTTAMVTLSATPSYYDWCSSNPCHNGYSCYNNRCYCYAGYTGRYCEYYYGTATTSTTVSTTAMVTQSATLSYYDWCSPNPCRNGYSCYNNRCYCYGGYTGQYCEYNIYTTTRSPQRQGEQDDIQVLCDHNRFQVTVDHDWLVSKHPTVLSSAYMNIYFGTCQVYNRYSIYMSNQYSFIHYFISCGTTRTETYNEIVYTNRLYIKDNNAMITREEMGYLIECRMNKDTSVNGSFHSSNVSQIISSSGNFSASMRFSRQEFSNYIYTYPAQVSLNETIYAHINLDSMLYSLKSVIEECVARPDNTSRTDEVYYLIRNRCPVDSTTDMVHNQTSKFRFKTFDFIRETGSVYIECKVHICTADDNSYRCTWGCSGYGRKKRTVDVEEPITLSNGPFVYIMETTSEDTDVDNGVTTAMAVGIGVGTTVVAAFVITLVVKLKPVLMASAKVAPAGYMSVPQTM
ncbi:deleted in malignant brain tumors 1 protein isoform X2 [Patella vulgata]|uniref:deleted in malignant brain tumors 1 protein isoform X2 n=1 Tax=Patella vulgata TaxID=6465 RepID=UPI0024A8D8A6|nr:deleted in malignant brain tumors 1 protein isoform X2 [Patella vulgata]